MGSRLEATGRKILKEEVDQPLVDSIFFCHTGMIKTIVGGILLTTLRMAAASSMSTKHIARKNGKVIGVIVLGF